MNNDHDKVWLLPTPNQSQENQDDTTFPNSCTLTKPREERFINWFHKCNIIIWVEQHMPHQYEHGVLFFLDGKQ